ncbi:hypothetical protein BG011_001810, partial [Mortierella polycephala]
MTVHNLADRKDILHKFNRMNGFSVVIRNPIIVSANGISHESITDSRNAGTQL